MFIHELVHQGEADAVAIVDQERRITYKALQEAVDAYRNYLYGIGVRSGDRVGILSRNSADYVFAYFAIVSLGGIAVPINFQLSQREIAYIINDAGIKHLLTYVELDLDEALAYYGYNDDLIQHDLKNCYLDNEYPDAPQTPASLQETSPCVIIYTSGTTGKPKGAVLSHKNIISNATQFDKVVHCRREYKVLCVLPMYHCFGWTLSVIYTLLSGAEMVILDSFTPKETIETIRREKINDIYVVPPICSLLTKLASQEDMKSLRVVISGGTTLPLKIAQDFTAKFGINICEGYGLSEAAPVVSVNSPDKVKVGSIGPVLPGLEYRLLDSDNNEVAPGQPGELVVKGDNVMLGYWNLPEATAQTIQDGWLHTGDVAKSDEEGFLYIVDRIKDIIISMGENVYPREIEELVYQYPGIAEAAVVGVPDKLRGNAGACFYSVQEGASINVRELKRFLQKNLALYKIPREFHEMEELPRTTTGKIAKNRIIEVYEASKKK
ncbi:MAG: long-chain-fatty-acid--CoA ligase [Anaerovibrio sp.]|uniref:class I adenylate-forming enzyme family protein n=1 Tax=Anaerovibrio sp. TaxID=1872532 RepID=UPI0025F483A0|nr:long-chain-fatty-acid--CoA ligase [Anaerovibrio sp.]MCR5177082.1 long-chain-fatty-acid--CoA ligase [Anaerovibrio sp.]